MGLFDFLKKLTDDNIGAVPSPKQIMDAGVFRDIVKRNFAGYTIYEDLDPTQISEQLAFAKGDTFDICIGENGRLKVVVLFLAHNGQRTKRYNNIKQCCDMMRIPVVRFYNDYPNEDQYVINRINSYLNNPIVE